MALRDEVVTEPLRLRERHRDLTREAILDALAEIVNSGGLPGFSVQQVADRAGVSHRTVYRHFPSREALLAGLTALAEERMTAAGGVLVPGDADELPDAARRNFAVFDRVAGETEAAIRFSLGGKLRSASRDERTRAFQRLVGAQLPGVDPGSADTVAGVLRLLASARAWLALREDADLDGEAAGAAIAWAIRTLLEAASERGVDASQERP